MNLSKLIPNHFFEEPEPKCQKYEGWKQSINTSNAIAFYNDKLEVYFRKDGRIELLNSDCSILMKEMSFTTFESIYFD